MNKEVKFSRFVGIAIVIICIWIVVLALMSAITKNERNDNLIYIDEGSEVNLSIPKSNIITDNIDMEKEVTSDEGIVDIKVRLPKINIDTKVANSINDKIYAIYQDSYAEILKTSDIQKINIDYLYEYLNNDTVIGITVVIKTTINNIMEEKEIKFVYDMKNNKEIIE